jgi:hypothetical protein
MRRSHLLVSIVAVSLFAAVGLSAQASASTIKGTVVHKNKRAHSFVVAARRGQLSAVHANRSPHLGSTVRLSARKLRNGTFAAKGIRVTGRKHRVRVRGVVTYSNHRRGLFTVSSRGVSLLVRKHHGGRAAAADNSMPGVGTTVAVDVTVDDQGNLEEQDVTEVGNAQDTMDLEGQVLSVDTAANTISVSADDCDKSGASLVVHVPDVSKFQVGDEVELTVTGPAADGSFTLVQSSGDNNSQEADDNSDNQGSGDGGNQGSGDGSDQGDGSGGDQSDGSGD